MSAHQRQSFADGPVPRVAAMLLILICVAVLAYLHRETLFPFGDAPVAAGDPELLACLAERVGAVDRMQADGVVSEAQYATFRARAEAFCQQQFGGGTGASNLPPGLPR